VAVENGEWIMRGLPWDDPYRIRSWQELIAWIDEIGFLPLFKSAAFLLRSTPPTSIGGPEIRNRIRGSGGS